jgi:hypothetical protein
MNVTEGARRMRSAGKWIVLIPLMMTLLLCLVSFGSYALNLNPRIIVLAVPLIPIEIFGIILWLAGWIMEGFAKEKD